MAIRLDQLEKVGEATVDTRKRVTLSQALKQMRARFGDRKIRFKVLMDRSAGMIVLAPVATVPLREAWLYDNSAALKAVRAGIGQAKRGKLIERTKSPARAR